MKRRFLCFLLAVVMVLAMLPQLPQKAHAHEVVMTADEFINCLWIAYNRPNVYRNQYPYNLGYYDGDVIYFDCWNLGKAIIWSKGAIVNNYTAGKYATMDTSCGLGDWDGLTIVQAAPNCSSDFSDLVPGEWLYMDNHTGYYVGNGQVIECTTGWGVWGITISQIDSNGTRSRNGVVAGSWKLHGMVPWLDYSGNNWEQDSVGRRYKYEDGTYAVGWTKINDNWYYFSASTYMYTGWYYDEGYQGWYFFDPTSGIMQTGFVYSEGYHYYMDSTGRMLEGWQKIDGYWYYFNTTEYWPLGAMFTGWHEIDGEYYFFSEVTGDGRGRMQTGWVAVGTDWYYCNADGVRQYGWQNIDNAWYYLTEPNGIMAERTWVEKDGEQWYVNASGAHTEGAVWTVGDTYEGALDIGTEFYATIDIPGTGTRAGVDSDETSATYKNLEVQAVREVEDENYHEQLWYFVRREDGSYRITNVATGLCLDVEGGYVEPGTNVRVWNGNDAIAQRWFVYQEGDNYGMVSACNAWDKTVLDVADGLAEEGTNIRIWTHNGSVAQQFMVTQAEKEHSYDYQVTVAPTADAVGVITGTCSGCSDTITVALPQLNEADYTYTVEQAPTAIAAGIGRYTWNNTDYGTFYFEVEIEPTGVENLLLGDVDFNGIIDTTDYMRIKAAFLGTYQLSELECLAADVDKNGVIDATDYMRIKAHFLGNYVIE